MSPEMRDDLPRGEAVEDLAAAKPLITSSVDRAVEACTQTMLAIVLGGVQHRSAMPASPDEPEMPGWLREWFDLDFWNASPTRRADGNRADVELRIAWLTVHAEELYSVDPSGQLSAQLLGLRELLEAEIERGAS